MSKYNRTLPPLSKKDHYNVPRPLYIRRDIKSKPLPILPEDCTEEIESLKHLLYNREQERDNLQAENKRLRQLLETQERGLATAVKEIRHTFEKYRQLSRDAAYDRARLQ